LTGHSIRSPITAEVVGSLIQEPNEAETSLLMTAESRGPITQILDDLQGADRQEVFEHLLPLVYDELRMIARARLRHERQGHTLQPTALVHEAYIRLLSGDAPPWNDRIHFFRAAAEAMRRILIDHARKKGRIKRGGGRFQVTLGDVATGQGIPLEDLLALDDAIQRLEGQDPRMAEIVRLRFFAGLSVEETAKALEVSERTVKREWAVARAWLFDAMRESES
jgi:RNA polymerase sigma factor (TIGR02999 family)